MTEIEKSMTISLASEKHALQLSNLAAKLFHQAYTGSMPADALKKHIAQDFGVTQQRAELLDPNITTLFVEIENEWVGYAQLRIKPVPVTLDFELSAELWRIYVDKSCYGLGVGRQLLCRVGEIARERFHDRIWLGVWEHNERAIAFYKKLGFSVVGEYEFHLGGEIQNDFVCVGDTRAFVCSV